MGTRESPYPPLDNNGAVPQQQWQQAGGYAAPAQPPHMQQAQPYAEQYQQQQPQQGYYPPQQGGGGKYEQQYTQDYGSKVDKFSAKPKWNDLTFAILFMLQLGGFVALSVISLMALSSSNSGGGLGSSTGTSLTLNSSTAYLLAIISGAGLLFAVIMLMLVRAFTKIILEISLFLSVLFSVAYAIYLWYEKFWSGAIIFTVFAVIAVISYFPMRRRIPFSTALLLFVLRIAKQYPSVYVLAMTGALVQTAWSIYWSFASVAIYQRFSPNGSGAGSSSSSGALAGLMVFSVFSFYWTSQFIINFFLVVIAGIYGTFYFSGPGTPTVAWSAFKRASTYSMGSIALGSFIVALLDLLRYGLQLLQQYESGQGDMIGAAVACVAQCCVGCIAGLVEYFNRYAMIEIALYGKPYIKAAKDTWNLFKDRGIDALINDCLINSCWTWLSYSSGALCSAFAFIYLKVSNPSYIQANPNLKAVMIGYAFAIGFFITHTLGYGALSSGTSTIFVGLAEDPDALAERDPALFEVIRQTYPKVTTSV